MEITFLRQNLKLLVTSALLTNNTQSIEVLKRNLPACLARTLCILYIYCIS